MARQSASTAAPLATLLAPLLSGRNAGVLGDIAIAGVKRIVGPPGAYQVLLSADAAALRAAMPASDPRAVFVHVGPEPPGPLTATHQARLLLRPFSGDLLADAAFASAGAARLHSVPDGPATFITIWSAASFPALPVGLRARALPAALPLQSAIPPPPPNDTHADCVALARRLQRVEDLALTAQAAARPHAADAGSAASAQAFEPPRSHHPWPSAAPDAAAAALGLYDHRPDDGVLDEAASGEAFLTRFALLSDLPDHAGAVAAVNAIPGGKRPRTPDVTIIIPVHGQLAYTLNAIDSLKRHASRYRAEIVVVDDCSIDATPDHVPAIKSVRYHRMAANAGFVAACNAGCALARGRFVLLLNNDTRVVAGWLDHLLDSFAIFPRAGLVGSKMIYPDGKLQEAGNIVWRDGTAWNVGRGDDPNRPQYCHARQVDYVSGCSIALPTALWRQLQGFDPAYAPAYAEDADLAQRVLQAGHEVWFQPLSRVVHYEGRTSGLYTGDGVKAHQVANLRRLFLRWRQAFELHRRRGDQPYLERERPVRRRILVIDSVTPTPDQDAGSVQTALALRCCAAAGYKAHFVPEDNWLFVPRYTPCLQAGGVECAYAPYETAFAPFIRRYGALFDAVLVYRVHVLARCIDDLRMHAPRAPIVFHVADLHYLRTERQATLERNQAGVIAAASLKDTELDLVRRADCTVTHSTAEAAILAAETPEAPVVVWPLMMELAGTQAPFGARRDLCFLGGYRHPPNEDAAVFFATDILPALRRDIPDLRFIAAGAHPSDRVQALASDAVCVTGQIPDLAALFDRCRVFVCPLRVGAGAKGKIASALSHGIPVVTTTIGVEGTGLIDGEHVLVADTADTIAAAVLRLYQDPTLWARLSNAGQAFIRTHASLDMGRQKLDEAIQTAWRHRLELDAPVRDR